MGKTLNESCCHGWRSCAIRLRKSSFRTHDPKKKEKKPLLIDPSRSLVLVERPLTLCIIDAFMLTWLQCATFF